MSAKVFKGKVVSDKMQNTVVVAVEMPKRHDIYDKILKNTVRLKARNEQGVVKGDEVIIEECRPFSKEVSFKVISKIEKVLEGKKGK
ncbi:30S ribosomal protein S17 [candidate division WWE3 bacterium]|uniref:30S ribosomal protein S17 n=1 Tax=candidate division WWE3 bacterium TaxID=2053526 RepID=A0A7X9E6Z7_UNCKA|nr:30S ribosomal protein S17 [candidate division WWE3 bacterium]